MSKDLTWVLTIDTYNKGTVTCLFRYKKDAISFAKNEYAMTKTEATFLRKFNGVG